MKIDGITIFADEDKGPLVCSTHYILWDSKKDIVVRIGTRYTDLGPITIFFNEAHFIEFKNSVAVAYEKYLRLKKKGDTDA